jgi:hypothetical protein
MKARKPAARPVREAERHATTNGPGFRELLDHLGRLLAKEYVRLLRSDARNDAVPKDQRR